MGREKPFYVGSYSVKQVDLTRLYNRPVKQSRNFEFGPKSKAVALGASLLLTSWGVIAGTDYLLDKHKMDKLESLAKIDIDSADSASLVHRLYDVGLGDEWTQYLDETRQAMPPKVFDETFDLVVRTGYKQIVADNMNEYNLSH
jgi:hypothetical protein